MMMLPQQGSAKPAGQAVLVTGCSSGIGWATALHLAERGFTVFATVRKESDAQRLREVGQPTLVPICPLDLSSLDDIARSVAAIKQELDSRGLELYAVVNNAGGGSIAPIELMDLEKFRVELAARVLGPVALLQAFLPHIRAAHGRILWIATPALLPIPFVSSIHACDFAINCLARTLQIELKAWQIPSILIRCGGVNTAAADKSARELEAAAQAWPPEQYQLYAEAFHKLQAEFATFDTQRTDPQEVARVVYRALATSRPKRRYQIGHQSALAAGFEYLPQSLVDSIMENR